MTPSAADHRTPATRYSAVAIALHWAIAFVLAFQVALGWRMGELEGPARSNLLQLHKSVGISLLLLMLARLAWRLARPPPAEPPTLTRLERQMSGWVHAGFYVVLLALPLTGWAMISTGRASTRLFGLVPWPRLPVLPALAPAAREAAGAVFDGAHSLLVWVVLGLLALHLAGVLKHHFVSRDPILPRMAPGLRPGIPDPKLLAIPAAAVLAAAFAQVPHAPPASAPRPRPKTVAQADLYLDVVAPVLSQRCSSCHNDDRDRGGLSLLDHSRIMQGGAHGRVVAPKAPASSELLRRISLDAADAKFMPKGRRPLSAEQKAAIRVWIDAGAPGPGATVASLGFTPAQRAAVERALVGGADADEDSLPQIGPLRALPKVSAADPATIAALARRGFLVRPISQSSPLLSVSFTGSRTLDDADFAGLARLAPQVRSLSLRAAGITDSRLAAIAELPNLERLRLDSNPITDAGLFALAKLKALAYLNLVGTKVTDAGLGTLTTLPKLTDVYVWDTAATPAGLKRIEARSPQLEFHTGVAPGEFPPGPKMAPVT